MRETDIGHWAMKTLKTKVNWARACRSRDRLCLSAPAQVEFGINRTPASYNPDFTRPAQVARVAQGVLIFCPYNIYYSILAYYLCIFF